MILLMLYFSYVTFYMLQFICYSSYVTVHMLQFICYSSYVTVHMLQFICYSSYVTVHKGFKNILTFIFVFQMLLFSKLFKAPYPLLEAWALEFSGEF